jgi:RNA polymerase primary sigma factor
MLASAVAVAQSWDEQLRALVPANPRALTSEQEQFLLRVHARLGEWLARLGALEAAAVGDGADSRRAGIRYLEVLRMTVRTTLTKANVGLVRKEAWAAMSRARAGGRPMIAMGLEDLAQEGQIGLLASIEQFDPSRGVRFSTYALRVIRRQIDRAIVDKEPLVYLPEHALRSLGRIRDFCSRYRDEHGRLPSDEQIGAATGVTAETLAAIYAVGRRVSELGDGDDAAQPALERVPDAQAVDALRAMVSSEVEQVVRVAMGSLDALEREVLEWRFGLGGRPELTQAEIARRTGLSQQRIVQIESRSLMKILIAARLGGVGGERAGQGPGQGETLRESLEVLAEHGIGEREGLELLSGWLQQSDRFRAPRYLRERLARLVRMGLSRFEVGEMLHEEPAAIGVLAAARWRALRSR